MNRFFGRRATAAFTASLALLACGTAHASIEFGFTKISNDVHPDVSAQLKVTLYDPAADTLPDMDVSAGGTQTIPVSHGILFVFSNVGPLASSITDIYFSDVNEDLLAIVSGSPEIWNLLTSGVSFAEGAAPPTPPGNSFVVTKSADSNPPAQPNGINPGEQLGVSFELVSGVTFDEVVNAFGTTLKIAAHVQGLADEGSTWHEAPGGGGPGGGNGGNGTPEATSMAIWSLLACSAGVVARRRQMKG